MKMEAHEAWKDSKEKIITAALTRVRHQGAWLTAWTTSAVGWRMSLGEKGVRGARKILRAKKARDQIASVLPGREQTASVISWQLPPWVRPLAQHGVEARSR